jgi:hypothetical protein
MKRSIIHDENRLWFWPSIAVMKKLLYEILENIGIGSALKDTAQDNPILSICREYLIASVAVEFGNLNWCKPIRRDPARLSQPDSSTNIKWYDLKEDRLWR